MTLDEFRECIDEGAPDECWNCSAPRVTSIHGEVVVSHRLVWETIKNRAIPPGMFLVRTCRNTVCVNPSHMELMTKDEQFLYCVHNRARVEPG